MAKEKENKEVAEIEVEVVESKEIEVTGHKVKKGFTLDRLYHKGEIIYLPEGKIKETLISNKFI